LQQKKSDEELTKEDWKRLAVLVPGRTELQCKKRWLFIQQRSGNKSGWTAQETEMLKNISAQIHPQTEEGFSQPKEWTRIAEEFNKQNSKKNPYRTPRQCRERWINAINP
jgi:hypothetical protein